MAIDFQDGARDRPTDQMISVLDPASPELRLRHLELPAGDLDILGERATPDRLVMLLEGVALPRHLLDLVHLALELIRGQGTLLVELAQAGEVDDLIGEAGF